MTGNYLRLPVYRIKEEFDDESKLSKVKLRSTSNFRNKESTLASW